MANDESVPQKSKTFDLNKGIVFWIIAGVLVLLWLIGWRCHVWGNWIHWLSVLAFTVAGLGVHKALRGSLNIDAEAKDVPRWDPAKPTESLLEIHSYVICEAIKSTDWYWKHKGAKAFFSQAVRFLAWVLAAVGGLLPIVASLFKGPTVFESPLWASLFLGVAAALIGLDKTFGYSSGWARYVLTATNIRKSLEDFRLDWAELMAKAGNPPTAEQVAPLIERAKQFRSEVEGLVLQETKDWVTEFQSSMAQMEKDVAAQLANLKAQVDKTIQARDTASKPGTIQLTIDDPGNKAVAGTLQLAVTDSGNKTVYKGTLTQLNWASSFMPPGQYLLTLDLNNLPIGQSALVTVPSGDSVTAKITIS
jgi:hypothetical protein